MNDHYVAFVGPPWKPDLDKGSADGWMVLGALLHDTSRLRGGVLVTGVHFRSAAKLAHIAASLDWSTGGRVDVGLGAGWSPEECKTFGVPLGDVGTRLDRFTESVDAIVRCCLARRSRWTVSTCTSTMPGSASAGHPHHTHRSVLAGWGRSGRSQSRLSTPSTGAMGVPTWRSSVRSWRSSTNAARTIGRDPAEIQASAKVRYAAGEDPAVVAERAQVVIDAGATLVMVSFPRPLDAAMVGPIADALAAL